MCSHYAVQKEKCWHKDLLSLQEHTHTHTHSDDEDPRCIVDTTYLCTYAYLHLDVCV